MKTLIVILFGICLALAQQIPSKKAARPVTKKTFSATSDFAFDFYKKLASSSNGFDNIFFSPLSIYVAFGMLKAGAKADTNHEIGKVLKWQQLIEDYGSSGGQEAVQRLLAEVFSPLAKNNTINVANKLWLHKYFCSSLCDNYINTLKKHYNADLGELNFSQEPDNSRKQINKWVEEMTNQKIKDLLPEGSVNSMTRFVLTNAIYFKSKWKNSFDKKNTRPLDFTTIDGKVKKVPTMYQKEEFFAAGFNPASPYQILEMPYEGGELSMLVVVPTTPKDFRQFEQSISSTELAKVKNELYEYPSTKLEVYFPKFKVSSKLNLKDHLMKMGMTEVFNPRTADLSGITGYRGMFISNALHKAYVNVDEEGTEAAAATGITIELASLPFQFIVSKPFFYMIRHVSTDTILFMGRVMDPTAE